jgi:outer membrane immunogenic protein
MKKTLFVAAAAAAFIASPVLAKDFSGPRVELTAGVDDVKNGVDPTDIVYGGAIGYDMQLGKVVIGVEATAANVFDRADFGAGARLGVKTNENVLVYGRVGYTNLERLPVRGAKVTLDGVTLGGGIEALIAGPVYGKIEYRYTDFSGAVARHGALLGVGYRF